jgi:hypothetical protein
MRQINRNLYPSGGYVFTERDGTVLKGTGWGDLGTKVAGYRRRAGIQIGDVHGDIADQFCATYPGSCSPNNAAPIPPGGLRTPAMTFTQRVLHWFIHVLSLKRLNRIGRVDDATAAARAMICQRCPKQKALSQSCGTCLRSVEQSRLAVLNGAPSLHKNLLPCAVTGEDCSIIVHISQDPVNHADYPAKCWRRHG